MKVDQIKHNHTLTDILKFSIFSLLMLAPMINVGVRSAYVISNKNAYQSYYGETINQETMVNTLPTNMQVGKVYTYIAEQTLTTQQTGSFNMYVRLLTDNVGTITNNNATFDKTDIDRVLFWKNSNNNVAYEFYSNDGTGYYTGSDRNQNFTFTFLGFSNNSADLLTTVQNDFYYTDYNRYSYLDNVFEYSVNQLTESPLYNWVETTGIYTTFNTMNTQLGITNTAIALLLSYWFLLTVIYVIIDIIIKIFTTVTHMIGLKA